MLVVRLNQMYWKLSLNLHKLLVQVDGSHFAHIPRMHVATFLLFRLRSSFGSLAQHNTQLSEPFPFKFFEEFLAFIHFLPPPPYQHFL